jgi:hypothetical protein
MNQAICTLVPGARSSFWDLRAPTATSPSPSPSPTTPKSSAHVHVNVELHSLSSVQPGKNLGRVVLASAYEGRSALPTHFGSLAKAALAVDAASCSVGLPCRRDFRSLEGVTP